MALSPFYDSVKEVTSTTGTGTVTLAGAVASFFAFSAVVATGLQVYYCITDAAYGGSNREVGIGTYTLSGTTLSRDTVIASTNGGALVNFPSGTKDVFFTVPAQWYNAPPIKGGIYALSLAYVGTTSFTVGPGQATDSTAAVTMSLSSSQTISTGTLGAINGLDRTQIAGTVATSTSNSTVAGSGTSFLTAFAPNGSPRALAGTISSSSTTVTGTSTLFLSQIAVGDLIGNSSNGYYRVTAIASNTSLTIVSAPGTAFSSASVNAIENAQCQVNSQTVQQINTITSNTNLTLAANSSATVASGGTCYAGALPSVQVPLFVFLVQGGSGTAVILSTQFTTPFGVSGYNTYYRRIGYVLWDGTTPTVVPFNQEGLGIDRWYTYEIANQAHSSRIVNGGGSTAWTAVVCSALAPRSATSLYIALWNAGSASANNTFVRKRNTGDSTTTRNIVTPAPAGGNNTNMASGVQCDGAQCLDYCVTSAGGSPAYLDIYGCRESLA